MTKQSLARLFTRYVNVKSNFVQTLVGPADPNGLWCHLAGRGLKCLHDSSTDDSWDGMISGARTCAMESQIDGIPSDL